jgi:hypothetical protein
MFWIIAELSVYRGKYDDNFGQMGNYRYQDHNVELSGNLGTIKLKILAFKGRNNQKFI